MVSGSALPPPTSNFLLRFLQLAGRNQPRPSSGLQSFLHVATHRGKAPVEKGLPTVTSCCDSKTPGRSLRDVRVRLCPRHPSLRVRFGGAPGCVWARRAAHSWPGRRARRAPLRAAGCAGPERSELGGGAWPGRRSSPSHWPFVLQLFPSPSGSPRPPRAVAPGKFAFPGSSRVGTAPGSKDSACPGDSGGCVPGGRRLREGQP